MATRNQSKAITEVCLIAYGEIKNHDTLEIQHLIGFLLFEVGQGLA